MADFNSSLYLGLEHPSASLPAWQRLTTGAPAALVEPEGAVVVAQQLARLVGGKRGLLMPSTLHGFIDLFTNGLPRAALFWDEALYPVARWGIELAVGRGAPAMAFAHRGNGVDADWLEARTPRGYTPVIVTDGFCTGCGAAAPLERYVQAVRHAAGHVVIDDTQALGVFGAAPSAEDPFGCGGGGSLRYHGLVGAPVVVVASLAKAFGVPLAVLVGTSTLMSSLADRSEMRVHTSAPSAPLIRATRSALALAALQGARSRRALAARILAFRRGVQALGFQAIGGLFPVQSITWPELAEDDSVRRVHAALGRQGIHAVLSSPGCTRRRSLTFVLRADHRWDQIAHALHALSTTLPPRCARPWPRHPSRQLITGAVS